MKAFVAYDKSGRISAVGVPNPEFGEHIVMETTDGDSTVVIDCSEIVKGVGRLNFVPSVESDDRLQEVVRIIVERYRVDPATRRLVVKDASKGS
jgi:hypothetical protein